jgi:hypothetical protein
MQLLAQEQQRRALREERERQEEKERLAREAQQRAQEQQFNLKRFELGLEEYAPLEQQAAQMEQLGGLRGAPGSLGMAGDALAMMGKQARERLQKGRTFDYTDSAGKATKYFQPYERTEAGKAEMATRQGVQALQAAGFTPQESQAIMASPENMRGALLDRLRPKPQQPGAPQRVVQADGSVAFVQVPELQPGQRFDTGMRERVPTGPRPSVPRPPARPTEAQEKSYLYAKLMDDASVTMDELGQSGKISGWKLASAIRTPFGAGNVILNDEEQEYLRAARDFAAGVLRKESGAAITPNELRDVFQRYVPAPGDSPDLAKAKSAARATYMQSMRKLAEPARRYYDYSNTPQGAGGDSMSMDEMIQYFLNPG